jgi:cell wall-associated NlpC family hydrolase
MPNVDLEIAHREIVTSTRAAMITVAKEWIGTPYLFGGNSDAGIDCSHFVYQVLNEARKRVAMPGPAPQLVDYRSTGTMIASNLFFPIKTPEGADLVLWDGHVAILLDPGSKTFIGAQSSGVGQDNYASPYWANRSGLQFVRFVHFF